MTLGVVLLIGVAVGWFIGHQTTAYPSEDVMFDALVELRAKRKIEVNSRSKNLEEASDRLAKPDF